MVPVYSTPLPGFHSTTCHLAPTQLFSGSVEQVVVFILGALLVFAGDRSAQYLVKYFYNLYFFTLGHVTARDPLAHFLY